MSDPTTTIDDKNILVTGYPRSGTSYFCTLLNMFENYALINEPEGFTASLFIGELRPNIINFYKTSRNKILNQVPINNKLVDDTKHAKARGTPWVPKNLTDNQFILGMKRTLGLIPVLNSVIKEIPEIPVIALIRNPYNNISSWKTSFSHLKAAILPILLQKEICDFLPSPEIKIEIEKIEKTSDLSVRRCLLWNYIGNTLLTNQEKMTVIKYEDLIRDPMRVMKENFNLQTNDLYDGNQIQSSCRPTSSNHLTTEDKDNIKKMCLETATKLGYHL